MKKTTLLLLLCSLFLSTNLVSAQGKKANATKKVAAAPKKSANAEAPKEVNQDEMMKAWQLYMTPGEVHQMIARSDGEWVGEVTHWMSPEDKPVSSKCNATNKMIMGGRYQQTEFKGEFMGMPFEGLGTLAYDNAKKVYITTWIDNMGTGLMVMEGTWNDKTKTINFAGTMVDPVSGKDTKATQRFQMLDDNTQLMEMFSPRPDGKGMFKTMELKLKRG
jgi:hypothetical protein